MVARLEPWLIELKKQRRPLLSGLAAPLDMVASGKQIQRFQDLAASQPDGLDALAELAQIRQLHQTLQARGGTAEGLR